MSTDPIARPTPGDLAAPDRELGFQFNGLSSEDEAHAILAALVPIIQELGGTEDDPGLALGHLRHVVFTNDLPDEVFYWQRQLGRQVAITDGEFQAVGKAMSWTSGPNEINSVALYSLNIGFGVLDEKPLARTLVAHELAHVHYAPLLRAAFGPAVERAPTASDWPSVRHQLALWSFDEFLAEHVACGFMDDDCRDLSRETLEQIAAATHMSVRERVAAYRHDGDDEALWGSTITSISALMNQLGRVAGLGPRFAKEHLATLEAARTGLGDQLMAVSEALEPVLSESSDELGRRSLEPLEQVVEAAFAGVGVVPQWHEAKGSLGIDVPFWPGDRERAERERYERVLGPGATRLADTLQVVQSIADALATLGHRNA